MKLLSMQKKSNLPLDKTFNLWYNITIWKQLKIIMRTISLLLPPTL